MGYRNAPAAFGQINEARILEMSDSGILAEQVRLR